MKSIVIAAVVCISGCAVSPSEKAMSVKDADQKMVEACTYLGEVEGTSGWGGVAGHSAGRSNAMNAARSKAADLGATHIVWEGHDAGMMTLANGRAYRCP